MMHSRRLSLIGSAVIALLIPMSTVAYVTPDQTLFQDQFMNNYAPPPSTRQTNSRAQTQSETAAERRQREQAAYFAAQSGASSSDELHGAAWEEDTTTNDSNLADAIKSLQQTISQMQNSSASNVSTREQRILDRIAAQQETLHGGAPLDGKGSSCVDGKGYYDGKGFDGKGVDGKGGCTIGSGAPLNESGPGSWVALGLVIGALWLTLKKATSVAALAAVPQTNRTLIR